LILGPGLLGARPTHAQIDVNMAFHPAVADLGRRVAFFASVENLGAQNERVAVSLTIKAGIITIGPMLGVFTLAPGEEQSIEIPFFVIFPGVMKVTLVGTTGTFTDTAVATLTARGFGPPPSAEDLRMFGAEVLDALERSPVSVEDSSWGRIKALFR
jgi:hypothetical protein